MCVGDIFKFSIYAMYNVHAAEHQYLVGLYSTNSVTLHERY